MSLSIFVRYEPDGSPSFSSVTKTLNLMVSRLQTGADLSKEIYKKSKGELKKSVDDYKLYWPEKKLWIHPRNQVGLLHLEAGAKLEYRSRKRHIKLRFLDASSKLLIVDETKPVKELIEDICEQLRVDCPQELSLVVAGDYEVQKHHPAKNKSKNLTRVGSSSPGETRRINLVNRKEKNALILTNSPHPLSPSIRRKTPGSISGSKKSWSANNVKKQISKKHQIRLDTPWLDPTKTLAEQEVTERDELILMYRFYYNMDLQRNSVNVELLYKQARATYLAGELLCSPNDMIRLSAILCQITKGNYSKQKYSPDFISLIKGVIAPPKCKIKAISKQIIAEHSSLESVTVADAKCWFIKLWSSLELFGMEFLSCTNIDTKDKGLIGISKDKIMFLYHKHKKNIFWDMDKLTQWTHDPDNDVVSLAFSHSRSTEVLNLSLPNYSGVLADCLQGHKEVSDTVPDVMRGCNEYQFDDEMESAIHVFAFLTKKDAKVRRDLNSLTYQDVYWASKIENPMMSEEELAQIKTDSWENPLFSDMDQLMDERFNFLDFIEYAEPNDSGAVPANITPHLSHHNASSGSPNLSPHHSSSSLTGSSPLTVSCRSAQTPSTGAGSTDASDRLEISPREMLHNGIMESLSKNKHSLSSKSGSSMSECGPISKSLFKKKHSRNLSSESGGSRGGYGPIGKDGEMGGVGGMERKKKNSTPAMSELTVR